MLRVAFLAVRHGAVPLWQAGLAAAGIAALVYAALYISLIEARHETISYKLDAAVSISVQLLTSWRQEPGNEACQEDVWVFQGNKGLLALLLPSRRL